VQRIKLIWCYEGICIEVFDVLLKAMIEITWKVVKLGWKTENRGGAYRSTRRADDWAEFSSRIWAVVKA